MKQTKKEILTQIAYEGIAYIDLILENCEVIRVPRQYIGEFLLDDIKIKISRVACNSIKKSFIAKDFIMSIHADFNERYEHGIDTFSRLSCNDITEVVIGYLWGEEESYFVDYDEGENEGVLGAANINQSTVVKYGDLYIRVNADKKEYAQFPEDKETRDFIWDMYDIKIYEPDEKIENRLL